MLSTTHGIELEQSRRGDSPQVTLDMWRGAPPDASRGVNALWQRTTWRLLVAHSPIPTSLAARLHHSRWLPSATIDPGADWQNL